MTEEEIIIAVGKLDGCELEWKDRLILECNCKGWELCWGITLDSQEIRELGYTTCPYCKKPFQTEKYSNANPYLTSRDAIVPCIQKQPVDVMKAIQKRFNIWSTPRELCIGLLEETKYFTENRFSDTVKT